jgi:hypothetical protein
VSENVIDISDLDAAEVLAELYNNAGSPGLGALHRERTDMTAAEARPILDAQCGRFDYLKGRVLKVDLRGGKLTFARLYDRDNGEGAAQECVDRVRARKEVDA